MIVKLKHNNYILIMMLKIRIICYSLFIYRFFIWETSEFIIIVNFMNSIREFPPEYVASRPVIDGKYKVLFKLGTGRFSK